MTWLCNGDFIKESERKTSKLEPMPGHKNKWIAAMTILVSKSTKAVLKKISLAYNIFR